MVVTSTSQLFVKPLQYIEETTEGNTPGSGSSTAVGAATNLDVNMNGNYIEVGQVGPEDLHSLVQGLTGWESSMQYQPTDSTFIKYGINAANYATPTGTISKSLSIFYTIYLNAVENYIILKGSRTKSVTYTKEIGKADVAQFSLIHTSVSQPAAGTGPAGVTPVSTFPTGAVFDWLTGGANPFSWNSSGQNCKKFTITIERNTSADYTLGSTTAFGTQPHGRRIKGSFTVLWTSTTLEADYRAGTARTLALVLKTGVSTLTVTGAKITGYKRSKSADDTEALVEECDFEGLAVDAT
jgi:tail tube protein